MISKSKIKLIRSLQKKKYRDENKLFIAEGNKLVTELIQHFDCEWMIAKTSWLATQGNVRVEDIQIDDDDDIYKLSLLKNPQDVLAVFKYPAYDINIINPNNELILVLDGIQDPGNLGTIIRSAAWYGIKHLVCSYDTADAFGPKAIQATMGAIAYVKVYYTDLENFLEKYDVPIYGTFLDGNNIYEKKLFNHGIIVMGNEGNGIRPAIENAINERLYIPHYPINEKKTESLNVAIATAIICAEFRRRALY